MTGAVDTRTHRTIDSPVGPLTLVVNRGTLTGLYMLDQRHRPAQETFGVPATAVGDGDEELYATTIRQLVEYFAGTRTDFDLPLTPHGTSFQRQVWTGLCRIPYGETISYGELAEHLGQPSAARAVGLANGRNPIGIIIPCHRVIGANGGMTGYGGGLERKRFLLDLEKRRDSPVDLFG
jgi:methylated-DNA-[protein]-cysteine S-methyltransferase